MRVDSGEVVLSFIYRPTNQSPNNRPTADVDRERRLSMKRLRMIEWQAKEIERLTTLNASLAAFVLDHRDCPGSHGPDALLGMLIGTSRAHQHRVTVE